MSRAGWANRVRRDERLRRCSQRRAPRRQTARRDRERMVAMSLDSFHTQSNFSSGGSSFDYFSLPALEKSVGARVGRLPYSLKILLENLLRREDNAFVKADDITA